MARIALSSYMVRYPLGGMLSWALQWIVGLKQLGHDVYFLERSGYPNSCYDPIRGLMSDDCSYGVSIMEDLSNRFGYEDRWCFVDSGGSHYGLDERRLKDVLGGCDLFIDMGSHGDWPEADGVGKKVLVEGEPGFTQMKMEAKLSAGESLPEYDFYYSAGMNIGTENSLAPTAGRTWGRVPNVVATEIFTHVPVTPAGPYTTVMNWRSHDPIVYAGREYGQKDVEFDKFISLPRLVNSPLEVAVAGKDCPISELERWGWTVRDARQVTMSFDAYCDYIERSSGEFSVCKNVFVATRSGWFSDRSAAYLASGRPVVLQDTGFSEHLPCGEGLFAPTSVEEAAAAILEIEGNYERHSKAAREIAIEFLDAERVLERFLGQVGV